MVPVSTALEQSQKLVLGKFQIINIQPCLKNHIGLYGNAR